MATACLRTWTQTEQYARVYEQKGLAGWLTSAGSKPAMVGRMEALLVE